MHDAQEITRVANVRMTRCIDGNIVCAISPMKSLGSCLLPDLPDPESSSPRSWRRLARSSSGPKHLYFFHVVNGTGRGMAMRTQG